MQICKGNSLQINQYSLRNLFVAAYLTTSWKVVISTHGEQLPSPSFGIVFDLLQKRLTEENYMYVVSEIWDPWAQKSDTED